MACVQNSNTNGPCPQWAFSASTNQVTTSGFAYDAAGNLTTDGSSTRNYTWDAEGRLTQVTDNSDGTSTTYAYNALGQRAELVTTDYQLEQIFNPAGARVGYASVASGSYQWLAAYVPWGGRELAEYSTGTVFYFLHANALGSGTTTTNAGGAASSDILFYPWGQEWGQWSGTYDTHFAGMHAGLQGSPLADFTMYEAPFRFYASSLGRWHSPDPIAGDITNPQSLNRYPYVLNNPTTLTDPLGLQGCPPGTSGTNPGQCSGNALAMTSMQMNWGVMFGWDLLQLLSSTSCGEGGCGTVADPNGMLVADQLERSNPGGGPGSSTPPPNTNPCANVAGKGVGLPVSTPVGNIVLQFDAQGNAIGISFPITGSKGQTLLGYDVPANTYIATIASPSGAITIGFTNAVRSSGFIGAFIQSATFSNGSFTGANGAVAIGPIPLGSPSTPSTAVLNALNGTQSALDLAGVASSALGLLSNASCSMLYGGQK
jgi:RHS repeat-associated protein